MKSSFLHVSSEKALFDSSSLNVRKNNGPRTNTNFGMRMLLIEEEPGHSTHEDSTLHQKLAFSLVMDAALALVASSMLSCRGCTTPDGMSSSCRCCKVALLIPGETKKSRKRRMKSNSNNYKSTMIGAAGKVDFPLKCHQENKSSIMNNHNQMDENLLNQIHIKYINSLSDLIKYLAYANSLPNRLQPLDGVFVLGLSDLLSRDKSASSLTELTHACE
jgi:hypothetical protein